MKIYERLAKKQEKPMKAFYLHINLVKLFRRQMQNYATLCGKFIQHYVIRGDISPHFRRLIAVNDCFCDDNLIGI